MANNYQSSRRKFEASVRALVAPFITRKRSPQITFIVPVHNKEAHICECLESMINQDACDLEIVCIDDASTDDLYARLSLFATNSRLKLIRNTQNIGPGPSRNRALALASGRYVRFVDADDVIPCESSARLLAIAEKSGLPLVRGNIERLYAKLSGRPSRVIKPVVDEGPIRFSDRTNLQIPWYFTSYLFQRSALLSLGLAFPSLRVGEDAVFLARLLCHSPFVITTSDVVYSYRERAKRSYTMEELEDYILHALIVRRQFLDFRYSNCWNEYKSVFVHSADKVLAQTIIDSKKIRRLNRLLDILRFEDENSPEPDRVERPPAPLITSKQ